MDKKASSPSISSVHLLLFFQVLLEIHQFPIEIMGVTIAFSGGPDAPVCCNAQLGDN
jgi:hypothetical protein